MTKPRSREVVAIVPAAGIGSRMQTTLPKQYLKIGSLTLLEHSIYTLLDHPDIASVVVALHPDDSWFFQLAIAQNPRVSSVVGGETRATSVLAGLNSLSREGWVLVHDAARPCLTQQDLTALLKTQSTVGAILASPVYDTMKRAKPGTMSIQHSVEREALWHALTPQFFPSQLLWQCLTSALAQGVSITDEASALEFCGYHPQLINGRSDNLKVTRPEDLALAEFYLSRRQK